VARPGVTVSGEERAALERALEELVAHDRQVGPDHEVLLFRGDDVDLIAAVVDAPKTRGGHRLRLPRKEQYGELAKVAEEAGLDAALVERLRGAA
jgi:hypothetical protein